jgi:hypothetical protein
VMQFETQGLKNKVVKTQGLKMCLILNFLRTNNRVVLCESCRCSGSLNRCNLCCSDTYSSK